MPRAPAAWAAPTSSHLSPTTKDRFGSRPRSADARPASLENDELVLEYPQSASFSKRKIADPVNAERLGEALKLVAGRPVSVRIELRDLPDEDEVKASRLESGLSDEQTVERIKDTFDAEDLSEPEPEPEGAR